MKAETNEDFERTPSGPRIRVFFVICGREFDVHEVSAAIGLEPTQIWQQTRPELMKRPDLNTAEWRLGIETYDSMSIGDTVDEVLNLIWPYRERILIYTQSNPVSTVIDCSVTIFADRPIYELSALAIYRMAEINCAFGLDIFDYSSDDDSV